MNKQEAYLFVYNDIINNGPSLFQGVYDARNGDTHFVNGIWAVMEYIASQIDEDTLDKCNSLFCDNIEKSQEKAEDRKKK